MATSNRGLVYLDSSALVKLIVAERETAALRAELTRWPDRTSSELARIELTRVGSRLGGDAPALVKSLLAGLRLLAIDPIVPAATQIGSMRLRSLDAIHLATAATIAKDLGALITYDHRMATDGHTLGLPILAPS